MAAALEGMAEQLPLQAPLAEVGELPSTMDEALTLAESSVFLPTVIPQDMLDKYLQEKRLALQQMQADPDALQALHWKTI